jgi:hypothetical protein
VVLVAVVVAAFTVLGDDGDGLSRVREQAAVQRAERDASGSIAIRLRPGADARSVSAALDAVPDVSGDVVVRLGRAELQLRDASDATDEMISTLATVAAVRAPAASLTISRFDGIQARVERRAQAAPLALDIAERVARSGERPEPDHLRVVDLSSETPDDAVIAIGLTDTDRSHGPAVAALRAATALADRQPEVSSNGQNGELRVRADSVDDAAAAWREVASALGRDRSLGDALRVFVDRERGDDRPLLRPVLSGPADGQPDRAVALLRTLDQHATRTYATTDLTYAEVVVGGASAARTATEAARAAGLKRFAVSWRTTTDDAAWLASTASDDRSETKLDDAPATVLQLFPGVAAAAKLGLSAVSWDRQLIGAKASFRFSRPDWLAVGTDLAEKSGQLRRLARAVRAIDWPGTASFELILGPGSCADDQNAAAVVSVTSTARGRARSVDADASCTDDRAIAAARRSWNETAAAS